MSRIRLAWNNASTTIVEQRVYRSTAPLDIDDMPAPLAVLPRKSRGYLDSAIEDGLAYYYAVSSVLPDYSELISEEIKVEATPGGPDPHWDKVVALLHFDGDFTDETGGVVTTGGDLSFTTGKFSEAVRFTRKNPRTLIRKGGLNMGSGDFTIEAWVRLSSVSLNNTIFDFRLGEGVSPHLPLVESDGGNLYVWVNNSYLIGPISSVMSSSQFKHLALVRSSGVLSLWLDGVLVGTAPYTYDMGIAQLTIGMSMNVASDNTSFDLAGDIDELRITKGVARYTENFTPPTEPFPNN